MWNKEQLSEQVDKMDIVSILDNWDSDGINRDWFAVDSFDSETGRVYRLFVGDYDTASNMAARRAAGRDLVDYCGEIVEPGAIAGIGGNFYRCVMIDADEAKKYMQGCLNDAGNDFLTITEAAKALGVSRQAVHSLIKRGKLKAEIIAGEYRILRYSVELRHIARKN